MAGVYVMLLEAGFDAEYLDHCTLLDIDLFTRALVTRSKKQAAAGSAKRSAR